MSESRAIGWEGWKAYCERALWRLERAEAERDGARGAYKSADSTRRIAVRERNEARAERDERQQAIDRALSAINSSAYVGGPSEREAMRTVIAALYPFETQHTGVDASPEDTAQEDADVKGVTGSPLPEDTPKDRT